MRTELLKMVYNHKPSSELEEQHKFKTLQFLENNENCISETNLAGHITASAWLLSPDYQSVLFTHHQKLSRWLQLGGHVEDDLTIQAAALREAREESGIDSIILLSNDLFDIDVHKIPERKSVPEHFHYDLRFLLVADSLQFKKSAESKELKWLPIAELDKFVSDISLLRMAEKAPEALSTEIKKPR